MLQENTQMGQQDEMKRIYALTKSLKQDLEAFKKSVADKETAKEMELRTLQEAKGEMKNENAHLREENESKNCVFDSYYADVLEGSLSTESLLDLCKVPPSEVALEGTLVVLKTMFVRPVEFKSASKIIDLFHSRPVTRFSEQTFQHCSQLA
jgi:Sec-independent protein translocase protein TatA